MNTFSGLVLTKSAPGRLICQTVKIRSSFLSIKERSRKIVDSREAVGGRIWKQSVARRYKTKNRPLDRVVSKGKIHKKSFRDVGKGKLIDPGRSDVGGFIKYNLMI